MGRPRTLPEPEPRVCPICEVVFTPERKKWKQRFCNRDCARRNNLKYDDSEAQSSRGYDRHERWTGPGSTGYIRPDGYRSIHVDGVKVLEHRHVMALKLGRPLKPGEIIHHIDHDRANNDPANLELVVNQSTHVAEHHQTKKCPSGCTCGRHTNWRTKRAREGSSS